MIGILCQGLCIRNVYGYQEILIKIEGQWRLVATGHCGLMRVYEIDADKLESMPIDSRPLNGGLNDE